MKTPSDVKAIVFAGLAVWSVSTLIGVGCAWMMFKVVTHG